MDDRRTSRGLATLAVGAAVLISATAEARTINVNTAGGPVSGRCSLADAVRAANQNIAVNACPAGEINNYDVIVLQANTTYRNYGRPLNVTGLTVIRGAENAYGEITTTILGHDYGFPSPTPLRSGTNCTHSEFYVGGDDVRFIDVVLGSDDTPTAPFSGICHYAGVLTLDAIVIGNLGSGFFKNGAVVQSPDAASGGSSPYLQVFSSTIQGNVSSRGSGGISNYGAVGVYTDESVFYQNVTSTNGGAISFVGDGGDLLLSNTDFYFNRADGLGGALYLAPASLFGGMSASVYGGRLHQNAASVAGAIWLGDFALTLDNVQVTGNQGSSQSVSTFNVDDWVYRDLSCTNYGSIDSLNSDFPWINHSPRLHGDGTCVFP